MKHLLPLLPEYYQQMVSKLAEEATPAKEEKKPSHWGWTGAKVLGAGMGGMALGGAAGLGAAYLADKLHQHARGTPVPSSYIYPGVAVGGLALSALMAYKQLKEQQLMRDAVESSHKGS